MIHSQSLGASGRALLALFAAVGISAGGLSAPSAAQGNGCDCEGVCPPSCGCCDFPRAWNGCRADWRCRKTLFSWPCCRGEEDGGGEDSPLATDRPDFTESSTTVGLGRRQLEMGYTYTHDSDGGTSVSSHSYPEILFRWGIIAEWFELRIGWNMAQETERTGAVSDTVVGSEDIYLGIKLNLTEQCGWRPEMAIMPQMTVPTGDDPFTGRIVLAGVNWLYSWEVTDRILIAGSTQGNRAFHATGILPADPVEHYFEVAQSLAVGVSLTEKVGGYFEWYGTFPHEASNPDIHTEHYINGGFTYLVNNDLQLDVRAGLGLSDNSDDYFAGAGLAVRF